MRLPVLLLALVAAGPALAQASDPSRTGRSASLPLPVRAHVAPVEMLPSSAVYSWVDEADGRYVAAQPHTYLTPAQRTAWAAGADEPIDPSELHDASALHLAPGDGDWPGSTVVTCDVLKCVQSDAPGHPIRPSTRPARS